jgi:fatty-acyl-CoA synthase
MVMGNLACTSHGATMVIPGPGFDPKATLHAVAAERCTSLYGVPTMFIAELNDPDFELLRPVEPAHRDHGRLAVPGGGHEAGRRADGDARGDHLLRHDRDQPGVHPDPRRRHAGPRVSTVGRVHPHIEVKVVDPETGLTLPRGEPGELCTRGYSVMLGYWEEPAKTAEAIDAARWMHTGDIGIMDSDGYLNITGRIKDMVIRGGENVYPREIEEFLYTHPDVVDAQVVGVPDAKYGEELCAWVKVREGAPELTVEAVREFAAASSRTTRSRGTCWWSTSSR